MVVGFTFSDDQVPEGFEVHWDDWLGERADSVEDWWSGPFHQHLPHRKVWFVDKYSVEIKKKVKWYHFVYVLNRGSNPQKR